MIAILTVPDARPRKIPAQARSRATIEAVLTAAAHILEDDGLGGFNTNAVAERAGVSIGSLYQYFPNKDAILVALIEQQTAAFASSIAELVRSTTGSSVADDLRELLHKAVDWHAQRPRLSRIMHAEERRLQAHLDLAPCDGNMRASFASLLGRRRDQFAHIGFDRAVDNIIAIVRALMEAEAEQGSVDWPAAIERTLGAVMGYLSVGAPARVLEPA